MPVKNFKSPTIQQTKLNKSILVKDYMIIDLITFKSDDSLIEVIRILAENNISGGPVVSETGKLIGMITEADLMKYISESSYFDQPVSHISIKKYMSNEVDVMDANQTIFDAATKFYKLRRKRLPIINNGKLVGQITRKEILKAILKLDPTL